MFRFQIVSEVLAYGTCDCCKREIKHIVNVLDREKNTHIKLGRGCVKHYCGKTVKQIKKINEEE